MPIYYTNLNHTKKIYDGLDLDLTYEIASTTYVNRMLEQIITITEDLIIHSKNSYFLLLYILS